MRGKKFTITPEMLEQAYQMKMRGLRDCDIAVAFGIDRGVFSQYRTVFLRYNAAKRRAADKKSATPPRRGPQSSLDKYRLACVKLAELGENIEKIADQIGIPRGTLKQWMETDEVFDHEMRSAKDNADERVIRSLLRRAEGFTTREVTRNEIRAGANAALIQRNTTTRVSRVLPNIKAIELWLTNRRKWLSENQGDGSTSVKDNAPPVEYEIVDGLFAEAIDPSPASGDKGE